MTLATSTIAMSAYNLLTMTLEPVATGALYVEVCRGHGTQLDRAQFVEALKGLAQRKYIVFETGTNGKIELNDSRRRKVRWRDLTGDGWNNWLVEDPRGPQRLEDLIK